MWELSLVVVSGGYPSLWCTGLLQWLLLLWSMGSRCTDFRGLAHELSSCCMRALEVRLSWCTGFNCSMACGILPDQGPNPCPLHWAGGLLSTVPLGNSSNVLFIRVLEGDYRTSGKMKWSEVKVTQSWTTLCNAMNCSLPGSSVIFQARILQGIFQTQGSNPSLPHCRWILYLLSHQGSPMGKRIFRKELLGVIERW